MERIYREQGVLPGPSLGELNNPEHKQLRNLYNHAFTPSRIQRLQPFSQTVLDQLIDRSVADGRCEFIGDFCVPSPLRVIGRVVGDEDEEDLATSRCGQTRGSLGGAVMQDDAEVARTTRLEIATQRFFQPIIDRLRERTMGHCSHASSGPRFLNADGRWRTPSYTPTLRSGR